MLHRRRFLSSLGWFAGAGVACARPAQTARGAAPAPLFHDDGSGTVKGELLVILYPGCTALDFVAPHTVFATLMGYRVHLVAKTLAPIETDTGLSVLPTTTFDSAPRGAELLCVPGGSEGTLLAMEDEGTLSFLRRAGAKRITSVCTGALVLGAAGLLDGYRATTHWSSLGVLARLGAEPVEERVVIDRDRITGGGVTAGLDFGLVVAAALAGEGYAKAISLNLEYNPKPPFAAAGSPNTAEPETVALLKPSYDEFVRRAEVIAARRRG